MGALYLFVFPRLEVEGIIELTFGVRGICQTEASSE